MNAVIQFSPSKLDAVVFLESEIVINTVMHKNPAMHDRRRIESSHNEE